MATEKVYHLKDVQTAPYSNSSPSVAIIDYADEIEVLRQELAELRALIDGLDSEVLRRLLREVKRRG